MEEYNPAHRIGQAVTFPPPQQDVSDFGDELEKMLEFDAGPVPTQISFRWGTGQSLDISVTLCTVEGAVAPHELPRGAPDMAVVKWSNDAQLVWVPPLPPAPAPVVAGGIAKPRAKKKRRAPLPRRATIVPAVVPVLPVLPMPTVLATLEATAYRDANLVLGADWRAASAILGPHSCVFSRNIDDAEEAFNFSHRSGAYVCFDPVDEVLREFNFSKLHLYFTYSRVHESTLMHPHANNIIVFVRGQRAERVGYTLGPVYFNAPPGAPGRLKARRPEGNSDVVFACVTFPCVIENYVQFEDISKAPQEFIERLPDVLAPVFRTGQTVHLRPDPAVINELVELGV